MDDSFQDHTSTGTQLAQPNQLQKLTPLHPSKLSANLKPRTVSVYAQQRKGLWQPITHPIFLVMMSTFHDTNRSFNSHTVSPLAHCPTLDGAHEALQALARQHSIAEVTEDTNLGRYFKVSGTGKTRTFWVKEVSHARVLKMMDFDEIDGGLEREWAGEGLAGRETTADWDSCEYISNASASDDGAGSADGTGEVGVTG